MPSTLRTSPAAARARCSLAWRAATLAAREGTWFALGHSPGCPAAQAAPPLARDLPEPVDPIRLDGAKALYPAILSLIELALPISGVAVANNPERCCPTATRFRFEEPRWQVVFWGDRTRTPLTNPKGVILPNGLERRLQKCGGTDSANETVTATISRLDQ